MKLSQAKDYLPFVQAAAEGKTIQWQDTFGDWRDLSRSENIEGTSPIRIKPEPKLRPWKPEEVPVGAIVKTKDGKVRGMITGVGEYGIVVGNCSNAFQASKIFSEFEQLDGKPCGVEESV